MDDTTVVSYVKSPCPDALLPHGSTQHVFHLHQGIHPVTLPAKASRQLLSNLWVSFSSVAQGLLDWCRAVNSSGELYMVCQALLLTHSLRCRVEPAPDSGLFHPELSLLTAFRVRQLCGALQSKLATYARWRGGGFEKVSKGGDYLSYRNVAGD